MERKRLTCNSFVFYGSFYEAISVLPLENQARIYDAIFKFAFEDIEVELDGVELAVFLLIKPQLIANRTKYENGCKGGRPKKEEAETKPNENRNETEIKPKHNRTETEAKPNENENDCLLKILKNKLSSAGAYVGVFDDLIDEILEALVAGTELEDEITLNGTRYDASTFERIAEHITVEQVAKVANRLLQRKGEIQNREKYIQCMLAECFGIGEECK